MRKMRFSLLALTSLLAACTFSLTLPLPDQTLNVPAVMDTQGHVLYPKDPLAFPPPGEVVKAVRVEGTLEASEPLTLTLELYARLKDPADDPSCLALSDFTTTYAYACSIGPDDAKVGEARFTLSQSAPLQLSGTKLTQGVQQGKFWLGALGQGLPAGGLTLTFKNLKATLTVGP